MDIEKKALELVNEVRTSHGLTPYENLYATPAAIEALCRAIEQHEAFRREVSEELTAWFAPTLKVPAHFARFIIPQADPLDGVIYGAGFGRGNAELLREAADRQGYRLELVKKEPSQ